MSTLITSIGVAPLLAQAAPTSGPGITGFVFEFAAIIAIIYFIMIRPQQKQRQKQEATLKALKRGDEVITSGGIIGEVVHIREASKDGGANRMEDRITIKSAESRFVVERRSVARIMGSGSAAASSTATPPSAT